VSDTFCSIVIGDPTSRGLLVIGGDERAQPEPNQFTLRYDAGVMTDTGEDMIYGRFYPTATTLWDGRILVQAGRESLANPVTVSEIYEAGEGWRLLPGTDDVDLTQDPPVITEVSPPHFARHWADSVVLLDSRVLITGGSAGMLMLDGSVFVGVCRCLSVFVGVCRCLSVRQARRFTRVLRCSTLGICSTAMGLQRNDRGGRPSLATSLTGSPLRRP
jgi:hypothetical protein